MPKDLPRLWLAAGLVLIGVVELLGCGTTGPSSLAAAADAGAAVSIFTSLSEGVVSLEVYHEGDASPDTCPALDPVEVAVDGIRMHVTQRGSYSAPNVFDDETAGCSSWMWSGAAPPENEEKTTFQLKDSSAIWSIVAVNLAAPRTAQLETPGPYHGGTDIALNWSPSSDVKTPSNGSDDDLSLAFPNGNLVYHFADGGIIPFVGGPFAYDAGVITTSLPAVAPGEYRLQLSIGQLTPRVAECSGPRGCGASFGYLQMNVPITLQ
jgi:hypothetical protein